MIKAFLTPVASPMDPYLNVSLAVALLELPTIL